MCGIYASISSRGFQGPSDDLKQFLCNRGPDHLGELQEQVDTEDGRSYWISLMSTVLALRGGSVTPQPFIDPQSGSALCWNGEAWKIGLDPVVGNDGQIVFDLLLRASSAHDSITESATAIFRVFQSISGPFAFVFLDRNHGQIYFGRDRLGRRSLLHRSDSDFLSLEFASVADPNKGPWLEVEADGVYQCSYGVKELQMHQTGVDQLFSTSFVLTYKHIWNPIGLDVLSLPLGRFNRAHPTATDRALDIQTESVDILHQQLCESLKLRTLHIPLPPTPSNDHVRVAVLFSGGLDCTVLACIADRIIPSDQDIDLINVAFENPRVVQAAKNGGKLNHTTRREETGKDQGTVEEKGLFIELSPFESCPDRETGRKAFGELQNVCPRRNWRFVAVNVPYTETVAHRSRVINLIYPHNTEMDLSIGYALYFAARGIGLASTGSDLKTVAYSTPSRVLLSGLGADELFGGYTRHATAFKRKGYTGLLDELKLDVDRLGQRNLGRDDRVISHWGREARFPYLDENVVKWAVECPIWEKCGFQSTGFEEQQVPDLEPGKKVLRLVAHKLGMPSVAQEKKRAIQFGARTAKMEVGRTKGTTLIS